jgi:hypothetical protein
MELVDSEAATEAAHTETNSNLNGLHPHVVKDWNHSLRSLVRDGAEGSAIVHGSVCSRMDGTEGDVETPRGTDAFET